jgi:hypothetical protein
MKQSGVHFREKNFKFKSKILHLQLQQHLVENIHVIYFILLIKHETFESCL